MKRVFDHLRGDHFDADGACLYWEEAGNPDGEPLFLLHGGFGTMEDFNALVGALAADFHIVAIDLRGHGRSTMGNDRLTYARLAQDAAQAMAHRRLRRPALVGLNDGGVIAYRLAAEADLDVSRVVTVGSSWHIQHRAATHGEIATLTGASWRTRHPQTYHTYQRLNPMPDFDGLAEVLVGLWLDDTPAGYPGAAVERIGCPLLVVRGDTDRYMPRHAAVDLVERVAGAQFLNIPAAGMDVLEDAPDVAVSCIRRFLMAA